MNMELLREKCKTLGTQLPVQVGWQMEFLQMQRSCIHSCLKYNTLPILAIYPNLQYNYVLAPIIISVWDLALNCTLCTKS